MTASVIGGHRQALRNAARPPQLTQRTNGEASLNVCAGRRAEHQLRYNSGLGKFLYGVQPPVPIIGLPCL